MIVEFHLTALVPGSWYFAFRPTSQFLFKFSANGEHISRKSDERKELMHASILCSYGNIWGWAHQHKELVVVVIPHLGAIKPRQMKNML